MVFLLRPPESDVDEEDVTMLPLPFLYLKKKIDF